MLAGLAAVGAGCTRYEPLPLDPERSAARIEARSLEDPALREFLESVQRGPVSPWPRVEWSLDDLTLVAFFHEPSLETARAAWRTALATERSAAARPNPTLQAGPQYNLNTASGLSPWLAFVDLEVPIETAGKRGKRRLQARALTEAARLNVVATAWEVRARLQNALLALSHAGEKAGMLAVQAKLTDEILDRSQRKVNAGALAPVDLAPLRSAQQQARSELAVAERDLLVSRAAVARALGVPLAALGLVQLPTLPPPPEERIAELTSADARRLALTRRADIRSALAEYEASQAALQLEIARQYPDLKLGPGYEYDQGENKIGLMLGVELPILNRNEGPIAEATARRAEAAARFVELQTRVMTEIDEAVVLCRSAREHVWNLTTRMTTEAKSLEAARRAEAAGAAEPIDRLRTELGLGIARLDLAEARYHEQKTLARLEQVIQLPLAPALASLMESPTDAIASPVVPEPDEP